MPIYSFEGRSPKVDPTAFIAPTAVLVGDVTVEAGASVWFNTVLRGDYAPVVVREGANVQDGSVLHAPPGIPVDVGPGATIAHMCTIHGAHIGPEALIANHCTILDGAVIGARTLVAAHSLVLGGTQIPAEVLVTGAPAKVKGPIAGTGAELRVNANPLVYRELGQRYRAGLVEVPTADAAQPARSVPGLSAPGLSAPTTHIE